MLRKITKITTISVLFTLTSCTYIYGDKGVIKNRDTDYMKAQSVPPLIIPPGLSSSTIQEHYPVSYRDYPGSRDKVNLTPPELNQASPPPVDTSKLKKGNDVTAEATQTNSVTVASAATQPHKKRYLMDVFQHPEYIIQGLYPKKTEATAANNKANTTVTKVATTQQAANTPVVQPAQPTANKPATQVVQQAENTPASTQPKKKYMMDYFR